MKINGEEIDIDAVTKSLNLEANFYQRRENGLYLNEKQIKVFRRNHFDYMTYSNLSSLIFGLQDFINESEIEDPELEQTLEELQELHYYNETNK